MKRNTYRKAPRRNKFPHVKRLFFVVSVLTTAVLLIQLFEVEKPQVKLLSNISVVNSGTEIVLNLKDKRSGIRTVDIYLEQSGKTAHLHSKRFERKGFLKSGGLKAIDVTFLANKKGLGILDGKVNLIVTVQDFSFWGWLNGNEANEIYPMTLDSKPPEVIILDFPAIIKPGSSAIVVYQTNELLEKHGVLLNGNFHRGFPLPDRGGKTYGAIVSIPFSAKSISESLVEVYDNAGNKTNTPFYTNLRSIPTIEDRIEVSEKFLNRKLPDIVQQYPEVNGDMLDKYLYVNREIRKLNNDRIREVCSQSTTEKLWEGKFIRMSRSSRKASFADKRHYFYEGKKIDETFHLGIDLASVRHADVKAANKGKIVFADFLGIYGNMVILDHGFGVFSLYSHLSQILVTKEKVVASGTVIGKTGTSGMAGGDHLHLSMLVNGIFVNPAEWWDKKWVNLNIVQYLSGV
jgi:murein DD-endopeptidase MepM/ murein hydrolase activator NlpD